MYLSKINIKNFRAIDNLEVQFNKGITILTGENNVGKTAIMDALRLVTLHSSDFDALRITTDDFHNDNVEDAIEIHAEFQELSTSDEIGMFEALAFDKSGGVYAQINSVTTYSADSNKVKTRTSGGLATAANPVSSIYDYIDATYMKPLRDPAQSLKSSRFSYPAKYLNDKLSAEQKSDMEELARSFNDSLANKEGIMEAERLYNSVFSDIIGLQSPQDIKLIFNEPNFLRLVSDIKTKIDSKEYHLNGLGYNNILVIAFIIAAHQHILDRYKILIIEEPEAHLHPLMQRLLLTYLQKTVKSCDGNTQVIISTHSPVFASKAKVENVCHITRYPSAVQATSLFDIVNNEACDALYHLSDKQKRKLERFLDVTRAELFFSKKIILVEGIAEALILPSVAKSIGFEIDECGVTIINCHGLNFEMFIPILERMGIKTAIITDTDKKTKDEESLYCDKLQKLLKNSKNIRLFPTRNTFEWSLFQNKNIKKLAQLVIGEMSHNIIATRCDGKSGGEMFEYLFGDKGNLEKAEFAQEFADKLNSLNSAEGKIKFQYIEEKQTVDCSLSRKDFPENIIQAIDYVCGN